MGKLAWRLVLRYGGEQLADLGKFLLFALRVSGVPRDGHGAALLVRRGVEYVLRHGEPTEERVREALR